ncbi:uncharacterized protein LOC111024121 [Momordica charantia]|uniref:Uncharacterized protein LOC111024121 n=1 Tax=Momordica charantia TaxID=3673 RepID=A0A6J1DT18_MOMCH|nr:uncharacterized protein LOC111024121 [Momordica charantia]
MTEENESVIKQKEQGRYCLFHRDHDHTTQDCFDLREEVENLIRREYLKEYVDDPKATPSDKRDSKSPAREIQTVLGSPTERESSRKKKASVREARASLGQYDIYHTFFSGTSDPGRWGSSTDIISLTTYKAMDLGDRMLKSSPTLLVGFGGERVIPEEKIELPVTFGSGSKNITKMVEFLVVDYSSSYNAILGRPTIHMLKAIS